MMGLSLWLTFPNFLHEDIVDSWEPKSSGSRVSGQRETQSSWSEGNAEGNS